MKILFSTEEQNIHGFFVFFFKQIMDLYVVKFSLFTAKRGTVESQWR